MACDISLLQVYQEQVGDQETLSCLHLCAKFESQCIHIDAPTFSGSYFLRHFVKFAGIVTFLISGFEIMAVLSIE